MRTACRVRCIRFTTHQTVHTDLDIGITGYGFMGLRLVAERLTSERHIMNHLGELALESWENEGGASEPSTSSQHSDDFDFEAAIDNMVNEGGPCLPDPTGETPVRPDGTWEQKRGQGVPG